MNVNNLLHIIKEGENENVEFKQSFNRQVIETVVAFANYKGGYVIIGVTDQSNIVGVDLSNESIQNWQNEIKLKTQPSLNPDIIDFSVDKKILVLISIQEYPIKPVAMQGKYFVRRKNSNHMLSSKEINELYLQSIQTSWDSYPYVDAIYDNLEIKKIINFIDKVNQSGRFSLTGTPFECLQKLRLLKGNVPTNAAMLLFSKEELYFNVHIGRFKTQSHIIDDKMVRGSLFEAIDATMTYVISHLKVAFEITGKTSQRNEIFEYPLPALRELVLNSIIHRDYQSPTDIQIRIFDNEITIFNPGKLYGGLTIEDLKTDNYQAQSRNKLITEAFYLTKDIEKYGSGFRRIRDFISEYPTMYFSFEENSGGFLAKIGYTDQKLFNKRQKIHDKVTDKVTNKVTDKVTDNQKQILELISENAYITTNNMAEQIGISQRKIKENIAKLKEQAILKRIGSNKTGFWKIL